MQNFTKVLYKVLDLTLYYHIPRSQPSRHPSTKKNKIHRKQPKTVSEKKKYQLRHSNQLEKAIYKFLRLFA